MLDEGFAVEHLAETKEGGHTVLELEVVFEEMIEEGNAHGLGVIAGGYAALVRGGYDANELKASVLDSDSRKFGKFEVMTEWAEAYNEDEKTAADYGSKVLHTLETK